MSGSLYNGFMSSACAASGEAASRASKKSKTVILRLSERYDCIFTLFHRSLICIVIGEHRNIFIFVTETHDNGEQQTNDKSGDNLIHVENTTVQIVPDNNGDSSGDNAPNCAFCRRTAPEQRKQNKRTKCRAESCPCIAD